MREQWSGKLTPLEDFQIDNMMQEKYNPKGFLSLAYNRLTSLIKNKAPNAKAKREIEADNAFVDSEREMTC